MHGSRGPAAGLTAAEAILHTTTEALSDAYADVASGFIRRQQWNEAWRLIEEGRDRHELSLARAELLMGLLAGLIGGVIAALISIPMMAMMGPSD